MASSAQSEVFGRTFWSWAQAHVLVLGEFGMFCVQIFRQALKKPFRWRQILEQMEFIGFQSLFIILLTGFFTGAVFGLQIAGVFAIFRAEAMMGGATALALAAELAPLVGGFLLTGRVGSSMAAEIATMVVGEQIEALEAMGVDPVHYLAVPRVIASLLMMPLLCGCFLFIGVLGAFCTGQLLFQLDVGVFWTRLLDLIEPIDILRGLRKSFVFAGLIASVACYRGLRAGQGARGVGEATTQGVVATLLIMLICDFILSYIDVRWLS